MRNGGPSRRELLAWAGGGLACGLILPRPALARPRDAEYALRQFIGEATITPGRLTLDLPEHSDTGTAVPMTVGVLDAKGPNDIPRELHVVADGNPRPNILSVWFERDCGRPEVSTRIRLESAQSVIAVAVMPDGHFWRAEREVTVNFGACAEVGTGTDQEVREFKPVPRVSVPKTAKRGEVISIRALISHPMETGLRLNAFNTWVPRRIVEQFACRFQGRDVFRAKPYPAISTNPYFSFFTTAEASGVYEFSWLDTDGTVFTASAPIEVS
ncbi:thiosulfate oxidation carrier complex protein SoxZ [Alsobacter sp. SYSU M60028]|uniref:Thiosulfate oxidation carrier complex protein SoxZ n=1 Tax=Alsobacter ponti TaxID=2962936 RepID=A0ABT1LIK7_9HYPH|nr:thiosulfate oxidation carrier protein SoxY [Alsobacter ponti]MCP8940961.1 thiosulfate oxidation carrier complex protein SoxZ [Alsobacter ponti]